MTSIAQVSPGVWRIELLGYVIWHAGSHGSAKAMLIRLDFARREKAARRKRRRG